eukprot:869079-Amphidinium_carterae.1
MVWDFAHLLYPTNYCLNYPKRMVGLREVQTLTQFPIRLLREIPPPSSPSVDPKHRLTCRI